MRWELKRSLAPYSQSQKQHLVDAGEYRVLCISKRHSNGEKQRPSKHHHRRRCAGHPSKLPPLHHCGIVLCLGGCEL